MTKLIYALMGLTFISCGVRDGSIRGQVRPTNVSTPSPAQPDSASTDGDSQNEITQDIRPDHLLCGTASRPNPIGGIPNSAELEVLFNAEGETTHYALRSNSIPIQSQIDSLITGTAYNVCIISGGHFQGYESPVLLVTELFPLSQSR